MKSIEGSILIVGGAGYVGSHANKCLNKAGYKTIILDNFIYGHREFVKWGELIEGDLADINLLERVFSDNNIKAVMHFSAYAYVGESVLQPSKYYQNNVVNTLNLLDTMVKYHVNLFVFSSSCAVYGEVGELPIKEDLPRNPINPYGRTKLMVEDILSDYQTAYGLKYGVLRYFNATGADFECEIGELHSPETHLIPLILDVADGKRKSITIFGNDYDTKDGTCVRDYIHVNDLASAHKKMVEYLSSENKSLVLNLGNGVGYSVQEVIQCVEQVTQQKINYVIEKRRKGDPPILIGCSEKAKKVLGWKPRYNLREIIESAWSWHKVSNLKRDKLT